MKNYVWSKDDFELIQKEVITALSDKYKNWVTNKFQYGNEPSLRKRLEEIIERFAYVLNDFAGFYNSKFISDVVDTRNYLTHYDKGLEDKAIKDENMYRTISMLQVIIELCFLAELGFPQNKIKLLINRSISEKNILNN